MYAVCTFVCVCFHSLQPVTTSKINPGSFFPTGIPRDISGSLTSWHGTGRHLCLPSERCVSQEGLKGKTSRVRLATYTNLIIQKNICPAGDGASPLK